MSTLTYDTRPKLCLNLQTHVTTHFHTSCVLAFVLPCKGTKRSFPVAKRGGKIDEIVRLFGNVCRATCETVAIRFGFHLLPSWQSCLRQCCIFWKGFARCCLESLFVSKAFVICIDLWIRFQG